MESSAKQIEESEAARGGSKQQEAAVPSPRRLHTMTTRSEPNSPYPTTFVQADTNSFKQVVQMLTGSPKPRPGPNAALLQQTEPVPRQPPTPTHHHPYHHIPPVRSIPRKTQSGFRLYERRNHLNLKGPKLYPAPLLSPPTARLCGGGQPGSSPVLSPGILDFPALALSPVTPLVPDPFDRSGSGSGICCCSNGGTLDTEAEEEKAIKEKGFFFHPVSPPATPTRSTDQPRLLRLFPLTSPRASASPPDAVPCSSFT